jgi:hypothetical protein
MYLGVKVELGVLPRSCAVLWPKGGQDLFHLLVTLLARNRMWPSLLAQVLFVSRRAARGWSRNLRVSFSNFLLRRIIHA